MNDSDLATLRVRSAVKGDAESLDWIVTRLSLLLRMQAEYRLKKVLRRYHEPDDLVNEVWLTALPRLPGAARHRAAS